jgi:hypothetical protein
MSQPGLSSLVLLFWFERDLHDALEFKLNVLGRDVFGDTDHHLALDAGPRA